MELTYVSRIYPGLPENIWKVKIILGTHSGQNTRHSRSFVVSISFHGCQNHIILLISRISISLLVDLGCINTHHIDVVLMNAIQWGQSCLSDMLKLISWFAIYFGIQSLLVESYSFLEVHKEICCRSQFISYHFQFVLIVTYLPKYQGFYPINI